MGPLSFGSNTGEFYRDRIEFPFFDAYLNGDTKPDLPEAWVFETGTNQWRRHDVWPPTSARQRRLVLGAGGALSLQGGSTPQPPRSSVAGAGEDGGYDEYVSDPARPVPFLPDTVGMPGTTT